MSSRIPKLTNRGVDPNRLTDMQQQFVEEYLVDMNAKQAAIRAGFKGESAGGKLMANPLIQKAIGKAMKERADEVRIESTDVLRELASIGLVNLHNFLDLDRPGYYLPPDKIPKEIFAAVQAIEWEDVRDEEGKKTGERRVKNYIFWDKMFSLQMLAKHLGMLDERLQVDHETGPNLSNFLAHAIAVAEGKADTSNIIDGSAIELMAKES